VTQYSDKYDRATLQLAAIECSLALVHCCLEDWATCAPEKSRASITYSMPQQPIQRSTLYPAILNRLLHTGGKIELKGESTRTTRAESA